MMTTLLRFETTNIDVAIASITTLASSFLVFTIYDMLGQKYRQQEENAIIRQLNSEHLKHLELMKDSILRTRRTSHDNNRHLNTLKGLLEGGNSSQALNYLDSIMEYNNQNQKIVDSGNQIIDSIVNCEVSMVKNDCAIQLNIGRIPSNIKIQDYDMTIILSNLLENAREAILFVEGNSVLDLRIDYDKGMLLVIVKNSYVLEVKQQDNQFKTHKNIESHGFGLQNVQRVIEKYDGDMEINYDGKSFEVEIMLYC
jgi:sensor histidine kinase regulating citrate/malate metabolism